MMPNISAGQLAAMIDAFSGAAAATPDEMKAFYQTLAPVRFAAVTVSPRYLAAAAAYFHPRGQRVAALISSPLGAMTTKAKMIQARRALADGADELDVTMDLSAFRSGRHAEVGDQLRALRDAAAGRTIKVVYYSWMLNGEEELRAGQLILDAGITFLKTNPDDAHETLPDCVRMMKGRFGHDVRVLACGGIRTHRDAAAMLEAGADRIATSAPLAVLGMLH
jgi:deoxyribose-phosphate aldolase